MSDNVTAVWGCTNKACGWFGPFEDIVVIGEHWTCPECKTKATYLGFRAGAADGIRDSYQKTLTEKQIAAAGSPGSHAAEAMERNEEHDDDRAEAA